MKLLRRLFYGFAYGGLNRDQLKMCRPDIRKRSASTLTWLLPLAMAGLICLFIVSLIPGSGEEPGKNLYFFIGSCLLIETILLFAFFRKHNGKIMILSHIFLYTMLGFGIYEAVFFGVNSSNTVYCVMLVVVPVLLIDVPYKLCITTFIAQAALLTEYFVFGNQYADRFTVIETLCCTAVSVVCCYVVQKIKFNDIHSHLMLEIQRDTDMMTGANSRSAYVRDVEVVSNFGLSAGVIFADVNGLKFTNDNYGHEAGDMLIKDAFGVLVRHFHNDKDKIYRIGGDEFVVICVGEDEDTFMQRCEEMIQNDPQKEIVSCGYVWLKKITDTESAIKEAEKIMYADKETYYHSHPDRRRKQL